MVQSTELISAEPVKVKRGGSALINNGVISGGEIITHAPDLNHEGLIHRQDLRSGNAQGPEFLQLTSPSLRNHR